MNVGPLIFITLDPACQPHNPALFCVLFFAEPNPEFKKKNDMIELLQILSCPKMTETSKIAKHVVLKIKTRRQRKREFTIKSNRIALNHPIGTSG